MDGLHVYGYWSPSLASKLPVFHAVVVIVAVIVAVIVINHRLLSAVHLLFKWNIYLSLLCDWITLFVYKIIFLFLSSKYAVEACDTNKCC